MCTKTKGVIQIKASTNNHAMEEKEDNKGIQFLQIWSIEKGKKNKRVRESNEKKYHMWA